MEPAADREVFRGSIIRVVVESWAAGEREIVRHPGACAVVPVTPAGQVILVRQFRESIRSSIIEPLGEFFTSAGFTDERVGLFTARTAAEPERDPEEGIELVPMPLADATRAAREGRITDVKTALGLLVAWARESGV